MHIKRKTISKLWPVQRTGTKYMAVPSHNQHDSIPLMIATRDMLGIVKSKKELKKLLNEKKIAINGRLIKETNYPLTLFDVLSIPSINKHYRATLTGKKMDISIIKDSESNQRIYKIIGEKQLAGKKVQINLTNGRNILSSEKMKTGDFVVLDNLKNKVLRTISLGKDVPVLIVKGKHIGKSGKIKEIIKEGENTIGKIKSEEGEISTNIQNLFAIE